MIFQKWGAGGGVKGRLELFRKFIRFGKGMLPLLTSPDGLVWQTNYCHLLPCSRYFKLDCSFSPPCCPVCTCVQELEWTICFTCSNSIFTVVAWCSNVEQMQIRKYRRRSREIHVVTAVNWSGKREATKLQTRGDLKLLLAGQLMNESEWHQCQ